MRYEFYILEPGEQAEPTLRRLKAAAVDSERDSATKAVESQFHQLVQSNPELPDIAVMGGGHFVAVELSHSQPVEIRARQGKPARELVWVTDPAANGLGH